jgi:hypothetical protein
MLKASETAEFRELIRLSRSSERRVLERFPGALLETLRRSKGRIPGGFLRRGRGETEARGWRELLALSRWLFERHGLSVAGAERLPEPHRPLRERMARGRRVLSGTGRALDAGGLKRAFAKHLRAADRRTVVRDRSDYYISLLFSPKQRELVRRKLRGERFTKTEREYFSRVIRHRLEAVLDAGTRHFVRRGLRAAARAR